MSFGLSHFLIFARTYLDLHSKIQHSLYNVTKKEAVTHKREMIKTLEQRLERKGHLRPLELLPPNQWPHDDETLVDNLFPSDRWVEDKGSDEDKEDDLDFDQGEFEATVWEGQGGGEVDVSVIDECDRCGAGRVKLTCMLEVRLASATRKQFRVSLEELPPTAKTIMKLTDKRQLVTIGRIDVLRIRRLFLVHPPFWPGCQYDSKARSVDRFQHVVVLAGRQSQSSTTYLNSLASGPQISGSRLMSKMAD